MTDAVDTQPLPFGASEDDLASAAMRYSLYSSKTGAGVEEIYLHGDGRVVLRRTATRDAEPEIKTGTVPATIFRRLLEIADDQRLDGLEDEYLAQEPGLRRVLGLRLPGIEKQVVVDNEGPPRFERVVSAMLFAASLAQPAVLQRRFFHLMGPI